MPDVTMPSRLRRLRPPDDGDAQHDLRPVTAKWHRAHLEGRLNSRDGANEFRTDLAEVQVKLRAFSEELQQMAYGISSKDALTPEPISAAELARCLGDLTFGIVPQQGLTDSAVSDINAAETAAVLLRREKYDLKLKLEPRNAVGLGLSGGGIRSATFCLGAIQVLADRGLLKEVDFLSTVSGRRIYRNVSRSNAWARRTADRPIRFLWPRSAMFESMPST